jgi:hypothetical protein
MNPRKDGRFQIPEPLMFRAYRSILIGSPVSGINRLRSFQAIARDRLVVSVVTSQPAISLSKAP